MGRKAHRRWPTAELQQALDKAESLIRRGRAQQALELLEPLLETYPRVADLHYSVGFARAETGDVWGGLDGFERAMELNHNPDYWLPLAALYLQAEFRAHALHAFQQVLRLQDDVPAPDAVRETIAVLEEEIVTVANGLRLPASQVEKGLRRMEVGIRAIHTDDFPACIAASRRAIELLNDWPPPYNNLSQALFFDGQPEEAISIVRQVLSQTPDNVQALSHGVRFLAWTGQETEARALWARLKEITPDGYTERIKMAEAAATLDEDESVYQLLKPLDDAAQEDARGLGQVDQFRLAVAEANTGRREARRRFRALQHNIPWAGDVLAALKAGRPGPGRAERFPYFHFSELLSRERMGEFVESLGPEDEKTPEKFRAQIARFVTRFPQIVLVGEKMIWESDNPNDVQAGISILESIATPAAHAALRRFGSSQAGDDETRLQALYALMRAGGTTQEETLRLWKDGEWREVQLRQYELTDEPDTLYDPGAAELLNRGLTAFQRDDRKQAERLFRRALELDPRVKEAYNNLGTIYAHRGEHERAKEMYRAALEIDPLYVFPRGNLSSYLLDEDDVEGAEAMLSPLADVTRFHPQDMAFYSCAQARVLMYQEQYDEARSALEIALEVFPDYKLAQDLLEQLDKSAFLHKQWESFFERQHKRDLAKRARLQAKISTAEPTLSQVLPTYTKEVLTGMAHVAVRFGGWSALRKAELIERIIAELGDRYNVERIVDNLNDDERAALRQVLASGGHIAWSSFDARYGNDLDDSPYWQWHEPETTMGRLRRCGLLAEATVDGELLVVVPVELREPLRDILGDQ
jgi:Flp pilus assembly protein TadD